jgi:hypothetical protein
MRAILAASATTTVLECVAPGDCATTDQAECWYGSMSARLSELPGSASAQILAAALGDAEQARFSPCGRPPRNQSKPHS